ncbi:hypothetical protein DYB35_009404 [Aphanomyces astaci]|uniref:Uncharacterized protein n=1 Tax=Aphanomyces astaci TaxID=112090 RepID=A0A3R7BSW1_APHAT|nr:hypothetical protein DYB35_009404 [Aphanomyces astaci]
MQYTFPEYELTLYLAKLADGEWLPGDAAALVRLSNGHLDEDISKYLNPSNRMFAAMGLNYHKHFGMEVPPRNVSNTEAVKGATSIPPDVIASIQGALGLFPSQEVGGGVGLGIDLIEPDFPKWFFMRQAAKDVIKTCNALAPLFVVLKGSPGVGKSTLVVLLAFYKSLCIKTRVLLIRCREGLGTSMLCLDPVNSRYWRKDDAPIEDLESVRRRYKGFALYLNGFDKAFVFQHGLQEFQLLATFTRYRFKSDDMPHYEDCLVPFWSKPDLIVIGRHEGWDEPAINDEYFYSGYPAKRIPSQIVDSLGDGALKGIAFENYAFEAKAPETIGKITVECDAAMVSMASSPVDYWCPYTCSLPTIDCVAKLTIGGHEWVALIQITTRNTDNIDVEALEGYASHFPEWKCCYIALMPDK